MIRKLVRHGSHGKAKRMSRVIVALEHTDMDITYTQKRGQSKQVPECNETLRLSVMCVSEWERDHCNARTFTRGGRVSQFVRSLSVRLKAPTHNSSFPTWESKRRDVCCCRNAVFFFSQWNCCIQIHTHTHKWLQARLPLAIYSKWSHIACLPIANDNWRQMRLARWDKW